MVCRTWTIIRRRQRHRWTNRRVDGLRAVKCTRQDRRSGPGRRHEPLDHQYRDLLRWFIARCVELHHDAIEHAYERHVVDAYAAHLLGVVYDRGAGVVVIPGAAWRRHSVAARSHRRNQFLYPERTLCQRLTLGLKSKLPIAHGWFTDPLAAPLLVLWPS